MWRDRTVVVCASGPSIAELGTLAWLRGCGLTTIVTNDTWRLLPRADVLLAANAHWWAKRNPRVSPTPQEFAGERVVCETGAEREGATYVRPRYVREGGNSALRACHLAADRGATRVLLFGVDLREDDVAHWHGPHPRGLDNPNFATFRRQRRAWEKYARGAGRPNVFNCNPASAVRCFPFVDCAAALNEESCYAYG